MKKSTAQAELAMLIERATQVVNEMRGSMDIVLTKKSVSERMGYDYVFKKTTGIILIYWFFVTLRKLTIN